MFPQSTQRKYWTFSDENDLNILRHRTNSEFIEKHGVNMTLEQKEQYFLSVEEERILLRSYERHLKDFCRRFVPVMPKSTIAMSLVYLKRFYLRNSIMDYHPKEILVTCTYLACKVDEFNVSITQFVSNIKGDREKASDIIINNELLLMQQLNYNLTIHSPYKPVEGLLIDMRTRFQAMDDPDILRPHIDDFLEKMFFTDSVLIYAPSQIALAAILHAASKVAANLDNYVTDVLFPREHLGAIIEAVRKIRSMVKNVEIHSRDVEKAIEKKLEKCRNHENNPDSETYKQRMQELRDEDEIPDYMRYTEIVQNQTARDEQILGVARMMSSPN